MEIFVDWAVIYEGTQLDSIIKELNIKSIRYIQSKSMARYRQETEAKVDRMVNATRPYGDYWFSTGSKTYYIDKQKKPYARADNDSIKEFNEAHTIIKQFYGDHKPTYKWNQAPISADGIYHSFNY
jgi:hypothetical protein